MKKIAIISSHPIQYNAPLFALLAKEPKIDLMVYYTWGEAALGMKYDPDFKKDIEWDIPLLEGYNYTFIKNTSKDPGSHHFKGIINPTLNQIIEAWKPNIVWVWGWSFDSHLKAIRYFNRKVPVWFRGDSTLLDEPKGISIKKTIRRIFLTWVYRHVDKAFYVGTNNKSYFKKHGLSENQLVYAPHAVDADRFKDFNEFFTNEAKNLKVNLGINDDQKVLLFVGKFEEKKNPFFFIRLLKELENDKFIGIMVGNGILEEALIKERPKNVFILPFQNQSRMPIIYRLGDALVVPSRGPGETWGLNINEAIACQITVFASDKCGGSIDLLDENFIFNSSDSVRLTADKIIKNLAFKSSNKKIGSYDLIVESVNKNL